MGELYAGPGFRTCSHSGCQWPAVASLGFDYASRRAWLNELPPRPQPSTYDLCAVHADRFKPPQGWETEDLRSLPEPLFHPKEPQEDSIEDEGPIHQLKALEGEGSSPSPTPQRRASDRPPRDRRTSDRPSQGAIAADARGVTATQAGLPEV